MIHRVLQSEGIESHVVDPASILTSRRAHLQRYKTGRLPREKLEHLGSHQALAEHHPAGRIGPVRLKYPLRNIEPYRAKQPARDLTRDGVFSWDEGCGDQACRENRN